MSKGYDEHYKARVKDAVLKAIVRESLAPNPEGGRTARIKLAEAFDGAVEALAMLSARNQRLGARGEAGAADGALHLSRLLAAVKSEIATAEAGASPN